MADKRISQLIERTDIANNDVLPIVASGATTTNKVTISTLQDWMQDNLDVGVTSVGITLGTSGTDVNVTGSPITTSGNITINFPTASATNRGLLSAADWTTFNNKADAGNYVTLDTAQTITAQKTFTNSILLKNSSLDGLILESYSPNALEIGATILGTTYYSSIVFPAGNQSWNLPNASGTLALTSDLGGYVTLGTAQTITGQKTFNSTIVGQNATLTSSGSGQTLLVTHSSGSGVALDISKGGNGEGLRVTKTSGSGNAVTITGGNLEAPTIVRTGGTSTQYLMADGSVSTLTNPITGTGTTNFVPKFTSGGLGIIGNSTIQDSGSEITLGNPTNVIGALNGTSASFTGNVGIGVGSNVNYPLLISRSTAGVGLQIENSTTYSHLRLQSSGTNQDSYLTLNPTGTGNAIIQVGDTNRVTISSTGAATFSGLVTTNTVFRIVQASVVQGGLYTYNQVLGSGTDYSIGLQSETEAFIATGGTTTKRLTITSSGNVGIGTASPWAKLDVFIDTGTGYQTVGRFLGGTNANGNAGGIAVGTTQTITGYIYGEQASTNSGALVFGTQTSGAYTERMRITSGGNVGIGTNNPIGGRLHIADSGADNTGLYINNNTFGHFFTKFAYQGSVVGSISYNGSNTVYTTTSDYRLKQDLKSFNGLDLISKIKVYDYEWKSDNSRMNGVLAHELQEVVPYAVVGQKDDEQMQGVDYSKLVPILVQAIQELKAEIDSLKTK